MIIIRKISKENINSFLISGYFFNSVYEYDDFMKDYTFKEEYNNLSIEEIIPFGKELLLTTFEKMFDTNQTHLVPLSGGLDSRLILAILLEFTESKNIHTYTYGTPKTLDYDIGNEIAGIAGTNHTHFDLRMQKYSINELIDVSNRMKNQTFLFHHPPVELITSLSKDIKLWNGFLGDQTRGNKTNLSLDRFNLKKSFLEENQLNHSIKFNTNEINDIINFIPDINTYKNLTDYETMDVGFRQRRFMAPHILFEGPEYKLPFIEKEWLDFSFSINQKYRKNEYFYREIVRNGFPDLFKLRAKNFGGLTINSSQINIFRKKVQNRLKSKLNKKTNLFSNPLINYVDFSNEIRFNKSLQNVILENLLDFQKRCILNINLEEKFKQHINKEGEFTKLLLIITSLEINLKALERKGYSV